MVDTRGLYLDLMKRVLTNLVYEDAPIKVFDLGDGAAPESSRLLGRDWPSVAHTMIGLKRLDNLQECVEAVIRDGVPGDLVETGVWRGGASIFMRAVVRAHGDAERRVWLADSFQGMPTVGEDGHEGDRAMEFHRYNDVLAVDLETVRRNFERYGLLDSQVRFLPGWFDDTLPTAPIDRVAVLRLDGDLFESTTVALESLYPKLSPGGFLIVDDYVIPACAEAVHAYRAAHGITEPVQDIDGGAVFWRRSG
ncbi:TylF/MycF family methyltransferase [Actinosynnema sp. NPDC023587]|uniref:TylF/MycF family methyltransferase n=1 Tax=Actinosynnema sp. NPDC023587 TaxID=3154695 RepID=UPI0033DC6FB2